MKVLKFGGTSVGSADRIKHIKDLICTPEKKIVVLSAMAQTTDTLVAIVNYLYQQNTESAQEVINELKENYYNVLESLITSEQFLEKGKAIIADHFHYIHSFTKDVFTIYEERAILAQGELLSSALMQLYLEEQGCHSVLLPALNFMRVDKDQEPDYFYIRENLERELKQYPDVNLFITQGYICRNAYGEIDNLRRGGSDYTASLIGAELKADEIQIWTDIDGMRNNDPRVVDQTRPIEHLSFEEAAELAYFGAKILHPSSISPAKLANIPVRLKNTWKPEAFGTLITGSTEKHGIKAIAAKDGITAIKIKSGRMLMAYGFLRRIFEVFEVFNTSIDMIATSEVSVSVTIDNTSQLEKILRELKKYGTVEVEPGQTIVCVVGDFIAESKGYASRIFHQLKHTPIRMISYGGSRHNISLLIKTTDKKNALEALNGLFGLGDMKE